MKNIIFSLLLLSCFNSYAQLPENHLNIGDKAPSFKGVDQNGKTINTKTILKEKQILLVFYRGGWCPSCRKHLTELQTYLESFTKKGYYVVVVTPESAEKTKETSDKIQAGFSILHDSDNTIMKNYKVLYEVNEQNVTNYYEIIKKKVLEYNTNNNLVLPVTATYIINKKGKIEYVHYNPDYTNRADFKAILDSL